ncbi:MAG: DUF2591 family protein [Polaromonas sp.]|nr:DUF2591 family protein [Polaromonas sp.]
MQTSELSGVLLDFWVAKAEGLEPQLMRPIGSGALWWQASTAQGEVSSSDRAYSTDWAYGGAIIEARKIMVAWNAGHWIAGVAEYVDRDNARISKGPTPLVAAMRAFVASRFGEDLPAGTEIQNG